MNFVVKEAQRQDRMPSRQEKKKENWSSSNGDALLLKNNKVTTAFWMDGEAWMCSSLYRQRFDCPHTLLYLPLDPLDSSCWFVRHQTLECKLTTPSQKLIRFVMSGPRNFLFPRKKKTYSLWKNKIWKLTVWDDRDGNFKEGPPPLFVAVEFQEEKQQSTTQAIWIPLLWSGASTPRILDHNFPSENEWWTTQQAINHFSTVLTCSWIPHKPR